jgi:hypothetical protein
MAVLSSDSRPRLRTLQNLVRITGAVFSAFFTIAFVASATSTRAPGLLYEMFGWGSVGDAEEMMLSAVYIVWGVFLWFAARDPAQNRVFIDFTIAANIAHFTVMGIQAIVMDGERMHLLGDVPLGFLLVIALSVAWIPIRKQLPEVPLRHSAANSAREVRLP